MHTKDRKIDYAGSNETQVEQQSSIARGDQLPILDPEMRLQQAAHILVNGAIRAAMKQRSAQSLDGSKPLPKETQIQCQEIRHCQDFDSRALEKVTPDQSNQDAKTTPYGRGKTVMSSNSKGFSGNGELLGIES